METVIFVTLSMIDYRFQDSLDSILCLFRHTFLGPLLGPFSFKFVVIFGVTSGPLFVRKIILGLIWEATKSLCEKGMAGFWAI